MADFDAFRKGRGRKVAWAATVLLLALFIFILPDTYQTPIRSFLRGTALRPFVGLQARLSARGRVGDPAELKAERDSLLAVVAAQAALAEENRRLREVMVLGDRVSPSFRAAQVLRVGAPGAESTFLIDVGARAGVTVGSPVLAPGGLVGMVWAVDATQSQAIDWTRAEFRASAMTADGATYGIVEPKRGRFREEDMLVLTGTPFHSDIRIGTRIVTSGRGALIPRGVPIGTIAGIDDADTGWRKSYIVRPAARPEGLLHVLVGVGPPGGDLTPLFTPDAPPDTTLPRLLPPGDTTTATGASPSGGGP